MFDSHAHVQDPAFDSDRDSVIKHIFESGVVGWIEVGTGIEESKRAIALAETDSRIYASVGIHPHELMGIGGPRHTDADWEELAALARHERVKAIGEVGLDFSRGVEIDMQEEALRRCMTMAQQAKLPMIFHVRSGNGIDAHAELLRILQSYSDAERPRGVIHTFSGTLVQAQSYIALGMMISFSGVLTFKNAGELVEVAKTIPLESILVETDCPYLTPEPFRGKRNDPSYVQYVIRKITELRSDSFANVQNITLNNAKNLFNI